LNYDVAVIGPPSLDLRFRGAPHLPTLGEEVLCQALDVRAGGSAISAITMAHLGLRVAVCWPVGQDRFGSLLAAALSDERVDWVGPDSPATPVTAVVAVDCDRAMIAHAPGGPPSQTPTARAQVVRLGDSPIGRRARRYVVTDEQGSQRLSRAGLAALEGAEALIVNEREASRLSGYSEPARCAHDLAQRTGALVVVVTRGSRGALAVTSDAGAEVQVSAHPVTVSDTTGAGDVFAGAYVWADLRGWSLEQRLAFANLAASLAVKSTSGVPRRAELASAATEQLGLDLEPH
jgi:ribokinase